MKIGFFSLEDPFQKPHGLGKISWRIAQDMAERGLETYYIFLKTAEYQEPIKLPSKLKLIPISDPFHLKSSKSILPLVFRFFLTWRVILICWVYRIKLLESHDWWGPFVPVISKLLPKLVIRLHGSHTLIKNSSGIAPSRIISLFERWNLVSSKFLIAPSNFILEQSITKFDLQPGMTVVIPHYLEGNSNRQEVGLKPFVIPKFIYVGRVVREKGVLNILDFFSKVQALKQEIELLLIGNSDSSFKDELLSRINEMELEGVQFIDYVNGDELDRIYSSSQFSFHFSNFESFGLTLLEAQANNCIPICLDRPPFNEIASHDNAILVKDIDEGVKRVLHVLSESEELNSLARNGRTNIEKNFSQQLGTQSNFEFFQKIA